MIVWDVIFEAFITVNVLREDTGINYSKFTGCVEVSDQAWELKTSKFQMSGMIEVGCDITVWYLIKTA